MIQTKLINYLSEARVELVRTQLKKKTGVKSRKSKKKKKKLDMNYF